MKPKEEAEKLVDRFKDDTVIYTWGGNGYKVAVETSLQNAKNCALICVDEKQKSYLKAFTEQEKFLRLARKNEYYLHLEEVKQEIEKYKLKQ